MSLPMSGCPLFIPVIGLSGTAASVCSSLSSLSFHPIPWLGGKREVQEGLLRARGGEGGGVVGNPKAKRGEQAVTFLLLLPLMFFSGLPRCIVKVFCTHPPPGTEIRTCQVLTNSIFWQKNQYCHLPHWAVTFPT